MNKQDLLTNRGFRKTVTYGPSGELEAVYAPFRELSRKIKLVWVFNETPGSITWSLAIGAQSLGKATTLDELDQVLAANHLSWIE